MLLKIVTPNSCLTARQFWASLHMHEVQRLFAISAPGPHKSHQVTSVVAMSKTLALPIKIIHRNASSLLGALSAEALALEAYEACQRIEANRRDLARAWDPAMWLEVGAAIIKGLAAGNALTPRCWEQNKTDSFRLSSRPSQRRTNLLCKIVHFVTYHHRKSKCIFKRKWDVLALCTAHVSPLQESESILRF